MTYQEPGANNRLRGESNMATNQPKVYGSMEDIQASGIGDVEYAIIDGFRPGEKSRIGSLTAGDLIEWSESNDGEAKRTAGLRLITKSLVGPEPGNVRYADDPKNVEVFRKCRHRETERIVKEILKLNGMNVKADGAIEAEAKAKNG